MEKSGDLKDVIKDNILGGLDKLETGAEAELKQEEEHSISKINTDFTAISLPYIFIHGSINLKHDCMYINQERRF